jgi:hypothetical protein
VTDQRHLREPFRHARRHNIRRRFGRLPILPAAAIGVAAVAAFPASQAIGTITADRPDVVSLSAVDGNSAVLHKTVPAGTASPVATGAANPPATAKTGSAVPTASPSASTPTATKKAQPAPPAKRELPYTYAVQINGWYCGPAATRIALTARGIYPSQDQLASKLGTTFNGTNSAEDVTRVLNAMTGTSHYRTTSIPTKAVTSQQIEQLRANLVRSISGGYAVVTNIAGSVQDINGNFYSFPGGHYIAVVGYRDNGRTAKIADPANPNSASYWVTTANLASWVGTRGYAS